jgi:TetR/AcrR family transcriptional repressor of nem operon
MARPRTFDVDEALRAAIGVFRERGYEGTTVKDLEAATGLKPGSLYHEFGSKEDLFVAVLARYNVAVVEQRIATYLLGQDPVAELRALFLSLLKEPGGTRHGCLLTNTAVERAATTPKIAAEVRAGFARLQVAFAHQCRRASTIGRLPKHARIERVALRLLHAYQGMLVLVRFGWRRAELPRLVDDLILEIFGGEAT